jgi:benzoylformate decarboxylase
VIELAELLGAPVYLEGVANTASFPTSHPLFRGPINRLAHLIRAALEPHDVMLSIGGDLFTLSLPSDVEPVPASLKIIHIDVDPWELGKNYAAEVAILADPKTTAPDIAAALRAEMKEPQQARAKERGQKVAQANKAAREKLAAQARSEAEKSPLQPLALLQAIGETLPKNAVVIEEALSSAGGIRQLIASDDPQAFYGLRGGGIGWGLPAAIGVKLALPDRPVVALIGDGSSMYTIQALWSAAHDKVPVTFVILNNRSYRILKQRTNALKGHAAQMDKFVAMDFTDPPIDFPGLARSMGLETSSAKTLDEVRKALSAAIKSNKPTLIDVELDRAFKPV